MVTPYKMRHGNHAIVFIVKIIDDNSNKEYALKWMDRSGYFSDVNIYEKVFKNSDVPHVKYFNYKYNEQGIKLAEFMPEFLDKDKLKNFVEFMNKTVSNPKITYTGYIFQEHSPSGWILQEKMTDSLDYMSDYELSRIDKNKFLSDIYATLLVLEKHDIQHNDIGLRNILYNEKNNDETEFIIIDFGRHKEPVVKVLLNGMLNIL